MREELAKKVFGSWYRLLWPILTTDYFKKLIKSLTKIYKNKLNIYPKQANVFKAFRITDYDKLKIVIIGKNPYKSLKANGLAFSNSLESGSLNTSLKNISDVLEDDYHNGLDLNFDQTLESWAEQGVLLLNMQLTSNNSQLPYHSIVWDKFTELLLTRLSDCNPGLIYVLWGKSAKECKRFIDESTNHIIEAENPSVSTYTGRKWNFSFKRIDEITTKLYGENIKW